jgi:uncharacterized protein (TIGR00730 family)
MMIAVFCGSAMGSNPVYAETARRFGALLADQGIGLVYGGACVGLMGEVADAALAGGGTVVGVIPYWLRDREIAHEGLSELLIVDTMHERKSLIAGRADGFVAMPGGAGTMDEFFEAWTWALLGIHGKPCALLNVDGYFEPMKNLIDHMVTQQFLKPAYRDMLIMEADPEALLMRIGAYSAPQRKWTAAT